MSEPPAKGSPEWIKAEQAKSSKGARNGCLGCLGVALLFIAGCGVMGFISAQGSDDGSSVTNNSYEAIAQCEARIDKLLKAPATAEYDSSASGSGNGPWTVSGTVDAQNSFGATMRETFGCTVTMSGDMATTTVDSFSG